jgi:hypothetical protein
MAPDPTTRNDGFGRSSPHDQVLRNQRVGKTRSRAASGPRLWTVMRTRMSSGLSFAYSTNTSKYRSSSKMLVSAARTRTLPVSVPGSFRPGPSTDTPAAGTCRNTSCTSAWAYCRGRSSTPCRPRPIGRRVNAPGRGRNSLRCCRCRCSPPGPSPTGAR